MNNIWGCFNLRNSFTRQKDFHQNFELFFLYIIYLRKNLILYQFSILLPLPPIVHHYTLKERYIYNLKVNSEVAFIKWIVLLDLEKSIFKDFVFSYIFPCTLKFDHHPPSPHPNKPTPENNNLNKRESIYHRKIPHKTWGIFFCQINLRKMFYEASFNIPL